MGIVVRQASELGKRVLEEKRAQTRLAGGTTYRGRPGPGDGSGEGSGSGRGQARTERTARDGRWSPASDRVISS